MSIKLVVANRFAFTIKGHINGLDARPEPFTFTLTATRPPQDELRKLVEGNLDKPIAEVLVELVTDWSHVRDDHGNEVPFSQESFAQLLTIPGLSVTVWEAYISNVGARAKN